MRSKPSFTGSRREGNRRLKPDSERLLGKVIDVWAARAERLPVSGIVEKCRRRARHPWVCRRQ
jgi:hypothetical protein